MQPIVVRYAHSNQKWTVEVSGHGRKLSATASTIVEAKDRADHLVKDISSSLPGTPIVVHLIDGSAIEFTRAYLSALLFVSTDDRRPNSERD